MIGEVHYLFTPMTAQAETLPTRIRELRKAQGLTLEQLGDAIGVGKQMMGMLERGLRPLTLDRQRAIARALDVAVTDLLREPDAPFTVPIGERSFFDKYRRLDAKGRQTLEQLADNLLEWRGEADEQERRKPA